MRVKPCSVQQLLVSSLLHEPSAVKDEDQVGPVDARQAMRAHQDRSTPEMGPEAVEDYSLDLGIDTGKAIVENQNPGVCRDGPGDRHSLPLPAGQSNPPFPDHGVEAIGKGCDLLFEAGQKERPSNLGLLGIFEAEGDVVPDGVGKEKTLLRDVTDALPQRGDGEPGDVDPIQ